MKRSILSLALSLFFYFAFGQCGNYTLTAINSGCTYNQLTVSGASSATEIVWKYNGLTLSEVFQGALVGSITTAAGGNGNGNAANQIFGPSGVSVDHAGNIYVADKFNFRIQKFAPGNPDAVTVAGGNGEGSAANQLWDPFKVFLDSAGNIYIPDFGNDRVQKFPAGSTSLTNGVTVAGGNGAGSAANQLNGPISVYVDGPGNVYVADLNNNRIQKFPVGSTSATAGITVAGGNGAGSAANQFNSPYSVRLDSSGYIYVVDGGINRIQRFPPGSTSDSIAVTIAGGNGSGAAANQFNSPTDMYIDVQGNLYVTDLYNERVQKFPAGSTSATNGVTVAGGHGNGNTFDELSWPYGIFVDTAGNIYIADQQNNRIQKWSQPAIVGIDTSIAIYGPGSYSAVVTDSTGCWTISDTITDYHFNSDTSIFQNICNGNTYSFGGHVLSTSGFYRDTLASSSGCDSIVNLYLTIFPIIDSMSQTVCQGTPYHFGSHDLTTSGVYTDTFPSVLGCDSSIVTVTLSVIPNGPYTLTARDSACSYTILDLAGAFAAQEIVWEYNGLEFDSVFRGLIGTVTTVAGGNGSGNAADQLEPGAIYIDAAGNIYVADPLNQRIQKFPAGSTSATNGVTVAGGNGIGSAANQFNGINGLYVDGSGNIYVTDVGNARIQKFPAGSTSATNGVTVAGGNGTGSAANQLNQPYGVCVDGSGNVYVADNYNYRIQKFPAGSTSATNGVTVAGGNGAGSDSIHLSSTWGICLDGSNNLYVCDWGNNRVQKFPAGSNSATNGVTVVKGNPYNIGSHLLYSPINVYVDNSGYIYVADQGNEQVLKYPPNSNSNTIGTTVAGGNGRGNATNQFSFFQGMYLDLSDNIYIADNGNYRVQKWSQPLIAGIDTSILVAAAGRFSALVTDTSGCAAFSDTVTVNPSPGSSLSHSICSGSSFTFGGHNLSTAGTYYDTLTSSHGCDSIITLTLTVNPYLSSSISQSICQGSSYSFGSHNISTSGIYYDTVASSQSCDTIITLTLTVDSASGSSISQSICPGSTYTFYGNNLSVAGTYLDTLSGASLHGCDSIITLHLSVIPDTVTAYFTLQPSSITPHLWYIVNQCTGTGLSYVWNWGDSTTSTGDTPSHTYASAGYYNVCVSATDSAGCSAIYCDTNVYLYKNQSGQMVYVNVVFQVPNGIYNINTQNLDINYYAGAVHFSEALLAPTQLKLFDLSGRMVMQQNDFGGNEWNINSDISQGVYILQLQNGSCSLSKKLMILQ